MADHDDNLIQVDENFGEMLNYAVRYAIGRRTYAPGSVVRYCEPLIRRLDKVCLLCMKRDIEEAASRDGGLGDPNIDAPEWRRMLDAVTRELDWRNGHENA